LGWRLGDEKVKINILGIDIVLKKSSTLKGLEE
jgi:hypothetical protein